jgi:hypothetical protein
MRDGMVYRVGEPADLRLFRSDRDSAGHVAGCPILQAGAVGRNEDWLLSFKSILAKPSHYTLAGSSRMFLPDHVVRLYGERDTISVLTALDRGAFWIHLFSSRTATTGSLGGDVDSMRALIQAALRPPKR